MTFPTLGRLHNKGGENTFTKYNMGDLQLLETHLSIKFSVTSLVARILFREDIASKRVRELKSYKKICNVIIQSEVVWGMLTFYW